MYDVVVAGGGIIGLSIGWRACQLGLSVCVIDRSEESRGASWVGAGMLAPVTEANFGEEALLRLNIESARRWPVFASELSETAGIDLSGSAAETLHVALDRDQAESLQRLFDYQIELGLNVEWLSSSAVRSMEPALHPSARAAVRAPDDTSVDPRLVLGALRIAFDNCGGTRVTGSVESLITGARPGVRLAGGQTISADKVVLAAGSWSGGLQGAPPQLGRVLRPVKGQILRLRSSTPLLHNTIRTDDVYLVPRAGGEIVLGATVEEKGFDTTPTAGAILELLKAADEAVPGIRELELAEVSVGLRPGTPDNAPLLGCCCLESLILATGHFRNGILQAPFTGDAIAHLLAKGEPPPELAGFEPSRFGL